MVFKGKTPAPLPYKFVIKFYDDNNQDLILRFFRLRDPVPSFIKVNANVPSLPWSSSEYNMDAALNFNPFVEGEDYEIDVLSTRHGFVFYVNGLYVLTYNITISCAEDIAFVGYRIQPEIYFITF